MNCREALDFLLDYVEGRLDPEVRASFSRHLADCPPCVDYLASYEKTVVLARSAYEEPCEKLPREVFDAILRAHAEAALGEPNASADEPDPEASGGA